MLADIGAQFAVIVPPKDFSQLAKKIIELVHDQNAYHKITNDAYQWIAEHDAAWACENYRSFIDAILVDAQSKTNQNRVSRSV